MTAWLHSLVARARARLAARPDTEHEQAIVRLLVGLALGLYLLPEILQRRAAGFAEPHILVWMGFLLASAGIGTMGMKSRSMMARISGPVSTRSRSQCPSASSGMNSMKRMT